MILGRSSIPRSLSFLEGFSYTKNNGYVGIIMHLSGVFNPRTQLIDALIESYVDVFFRTVNGGPQKGMFWVAPDVDWKRS